MRQIQVGLLRCAAIAGAAGVFLTACDRDDPSGPRGVLEISPDPVTLFVGHSVMLRVANGGEIHWLSSAPGIATVSADGLVTALQPGTARISAENDTATGDRSVEVITPRSSLSAKITTTCALTQSDALYCWGTNEYGQIGTGNKVSSLTPVRGGGGMTFTTAATGGNHSCGIVADGTYCWGFNATGNIGDGSEEWTERLQPSKVTVAPNLVAVDVNGGFGNVTSVTCQDESCSNSSCGIDSNGKIVCWGFGPGAFPLTSSVRFAEIRVGVNGSCALAVTGDGYCLPGMVAAKIEIGDRLQDISANYSHYCAVTVNGVVYCWGAGSRGELGAPASDVCARRNYSYACRSKPEPVVTEQRFQSVSVGMASRSFFNTIPAAHTCAINVSLEIYCWGLNSSGQLGNGTLTDSMQPVRVQSNEKFTKVVTGHGFTCALTIAGAAYCWGANSQGELGDGTTVSSAVPVKVSGDFVFR